MYLEMEQLVQFMGRYSNALSLKQEREQLIIAKNMLIEANKEREKAGEEREEADKERKQVKKVLALERKNRADAEQKAIEANKYLELAKEVMERFGMHRIKKFKEKQASIYVMSSINYLKTATFKVGRSIETKKRESNFNTARPHWDRMKCVLACETPYEKTTELMIHTIFSEFRDESENEMFSVPYDILSGYVKTLTALNRDTIASMRKFITDINSDFKNMHLDIAQLCRGVDMSKFNDQLALTNGPRTYTNDELLVIAAINDSAEVYVDGAICIGIKCEYYKVAVADDVRLKWGTVKKYIHARLKIAQGLTTMSRPDPFKWLPIVYRLCEEQHIMFSYDKALRTYVSS
jgi:hypothetical protein